MLKLRFREVKRLAQGDMKLESGGNGSGVGGGSLSPLPDPARDSGPKERSLKEFSREQKQ